MKRVLVLLGLGVAVAISRNENARRRIRNYAANALEAITTYTPVVQQQVEAGRRQISDATRQAAVAALRRGAHKG